MKRLAEVLRRQHLIAPEELEQALEEHRQKAIRLREVLHERGVVPKDKLAAAVGKAIGVPYLDPRSIGPDPELVKILDFKAAEKFNCVPAGREGKKVVVVMVDPQDLLAIRDLEFALGGSVTPRFAFKKEVEEARDRIYGTERLPAASAFMDAQEVEFFTSATDRSAADKDTAPVHMDGGSPVVRLVSSLIGAASARRASDIHIEQYLSHSLVRFRIDGVLRDFTEIPATMRGAVVSRIKILAEMDIAERRIPQDGSFMVRIAKERRDVRVSSLPTQYGEKIVMRLLSPSGTRVSIEQLSLTCEQRDILVRALNSPQGFILVTGPTGSGKSTSLYAFLNSLRNSNLNISTIEDPIEYVIEGANQVQVNVKAGRTFAACLRSLLRQDPNIIMVGEVRDQETAEIALQASQTGHLVLSTLHTNDAAGAITRLLDLGVPGFLVASSLSAVVAQRLVRKLCSCRSAAPATAEFRTALASLGSVTDVGQMYLPKGCEKCDFTGYHGRVGVYEVLPVGDAVRTMIRLAESSEALRAVAMTRKFRLMQEDAAAKVAAGITSLEEALRNVPYDPALAAFSCPACRTSVALELRDCATCERGNGLATLDEERAVIPALSLAQVRRNHAGYRTVGGTHAGGNS